MKPILVATLAVTTCVCSLAAQEKKPVPKDSVRVSIAGCTKGYVFTVAPRTADQPGTANIPAGTHFRMNGPKKLMSEIKSRQGSMIEITGITKKDDLNPPGVSIGGHVRIMPGPGPSSSVSNSSLGGQIQIDVEGWRPAVGSCPSR